MLTRSRVPLAARGRVSFYVSPNSRPLREFGRAMVVSVILARMEAGSVVLSACVALICHKLLSRKGFCLLPACAGSELALKADKIHLQMECCLFSHRYLFSLNG